MAAALKTEAELEALLGPLLGSDDPLFGCLYPGSLADFFDPGKLALLQPRGGLRILYGTDAALAGKRLFLFISMYLKMKSSFT